MKVPQVLTVYLMFLVLPGIHQRLFQQLEEHKGLGQSFPNLLKHDYQLETMDCSQLYLEILLK
jgi:hypothetical protein